MRRKYNLLISRIHPHNLKLIHHNLQVNKLPAMVDLRSKLPPVYDQGNLGSCTANALCTAVQYEDKTFAGSRLFLYYNERKLENDIADDAGAQLSDGILALEKYGLCLEKDWPYQIEKFAVKPPTKCYSDALKHKVLEAHNVMQDLTSMKKCLASGFPFVVGIAIYESFESDVVAKTGVVPMPSPDEECLGGHACAVVGYDDSKQQWIVRNSWGRSWGDKGSFYLPYMYLLDSNLATDLWVITSVKK